MPGIDKSLLAMRFGKRVESYEDVTPVQQRMAETLMGQIVSRFNGRHFSVAGTTDIRATYHILFVHCPAEPQPSALEAAS